MHPIAESTALPRLDTLSRVFLIGACGTGMTALALLLRESGLAVSGCDVRADPPTGPQLLDAGVDLRLGYDPDSLDRDADLVVVGNAVRSDNPVVAAAAEAGLPMTHMPAMLDLLIGDRPRIVIAGTHGKSTTSTAVAWLLREAGLDPGWFIGATPTFGASGRRGTGPFVLEGDEYNASFFDREAKFFHYRPTILGVTNVEFDHADLYPDLAAIDAAFRRLLRQPQLRTVVLAAEAGRFAPDVANGATSLVIGQNVAFEMIGSDPNGVRFRLRDRELRFPLPGRHGATDAAIAWLCATAAGADPEAAADALARFPGLRLRQERLDNDRWVLIRDFGHHPTEVAQTLAGLRAAWPDRHLVAVFEPRSYTARTDRMRDQWAHAFDAADQVLLAPVFRPDALPEPPLDTQALAGSLPMAAAAYADWSALERAVREVEPGAVIVLFSNGIMDGLPERLAGKDGLT